MISILDSVLLAIFFNGNDDVTWHNTARWFEDAKGDDKVDDDDNDDDDDGDDVS